MLAATSARRSPEIRPAVLPTVVVAVLVDSIRLVVGPLLAVVGELVDFGQEQIPLRDHRIRPRLQHVPQSLEELLPGVRAELPDQLADQVHQLAPAPAREGPGQVVVAGSRLFPLQTVANLPRREGLRCVQEGSSQRAHVVAAASAADVAAAAACRLLHHGID